jgi:hypothetical protein
MLDLMSDTDGIRKDALREAIGCPERTLERDINLLENFFTIHKTHDSDGKRRYHFKRGQFNLDDIKKPLTVDQIREG